MEVAFDPGDGDIAEALDLQQGARRAVAVAARVVLADDQVDEARQLRCHVGHALARSSAQRPAPPTAPSRDGSPRQERTPLVDFLTSAASVGGTGTGSSQHAPHSTSATEPAICQGFCHPRRPRVQPGRITGLGLHHDGETWTDNRLDALPRALRPLARPPPLARARRSSPSRRSVVASGMRHLRTEFNVEASLPANHPFVRIDRTIREEFGGRRTLMLGDRARRAATSGSRTCSRRCATSRSRALRLPDVMAQNVVSLAAPGVRHVEDRGGVASRPTT